MQEKREGRGRRWGWQRREKVKRTGEMKRIVVMVRDRSRWNNIRERKEKQSGDGEVGRGAR